MKKLLGISLVAVLTATPLMASAADLTQDQMAKANIVAGDDKQVAAVSYVKGAYTELGTAINTKQDKLTQDQLQAITDVAGKQDALNETQMAAVNSGITTAKVSQYDAYATGKQDTITDQNKLSAGLVSGLATVATTGNASDLNEDTTHRLVTDTEKATWNAKQDALTSAQQAAVDSGITSEKVAAYDALKTASAEYATKTGVVNTVNAATASGDADLAVTGSVTGSVTGNVPVLATWGNSTATTVALADGTLTNGAIASGAKATGTVTSDVTVASYVD